MSYVINDDFLTPNNTVTPEELKNPPRGGKDWNQIWRAATADQRD